MRTMADRMNDRRVQIEDERIRLAQALSALASTTAAEAQAVSERAPMVSVILEQAKRINGWARVLAKKQASLAFLARPRKTRGHLIATSRVGETWTATIDGVPIHGRYGSEEGARYAAKSEIWRREARQEKAGLAI
jgi:hypothetical protein